jgi:hypothetical protein
MMFLYAMTQGRTTVDGKTQEYQTWIPPVAIVVGLAAFYAFLFNRAFSITAKIKETETEIIIKTPKKEEG